MQVISLCMRRGRKLVSGVVIDSETGQLPRDYADNVIKAAMLGHQYVENLCPWRHVQATNENTNLYNVAPFCRLAIVSSITSRPF